MKYYLSDILPRLKKFSATLDQSSFLVDKPWVVSNNSGSFDKLIFRRDGRVHLSSDGTVRDGTWEYLPEAQSLLIDYGDTKRLYRHQYLDQAVLALKRDGSSSEDAYFLLANENEIFDCDAKRYLRNKYLSDNNIQVKLLENGQEIEIETTHLSYYKRALKNGIRMQDGSYMLKGGRKKIIVKSGNIVNTIRKVDYPEGIEIWQQKGDPTTGDVVVGLKNGEITVKKHGKFKLWIENGKVVKVVDGTERTVAIFLIIFVSVTVLVFSLFLLS